MTQRLLVLSLYYPPDLSAGSFRADALVRALREAAPGLAIDVITSLPSRYQSFSAAAPDRDSDGLLTVRRLALPPHRGDMRTQTMSYARFAWSAARVAAERRYDLVVATSSRLMTATLGAWISRRSGTPLYLDVRDLFADTMNDVLPGPAARVLGPVLSRVERWTIGRAAHVNLVSPGFKPYFERRYPGKPLSLFTNGIDDDFIVPPPQRRDAREPVTVVYAGNIGEGQGLHLIMPALAASLAGRARFRIIGDGGRRGQLIEALRHAGAGNVEVIAPMSRAQLVAEYLAADVLFLHLNDFEAFTRVLPSKIFEYAALGKPILAGVAGYAADFIRSEITNAAVFPPCDAAAGLRAFDALEFVNTPRTTFVQQYGRRDIMRRMAADIVDRLPREPRT